MNNSTDVTEVTIEDEARMKHLKTLIAVVPIVVRALTFVILRILGILRIVVTALTFVILRILRILRIVVRALTFVILRIRIFQVPVIFTLVIIIGFIGNLLVVLVVIFDKTMRSTTNILIFNLAVLLPLTSLL